MHSKPKTKQIKTVIPEKYFQGRILILVPHMDDAVLGCGGLLASITDKSRVRLVYCTDGRGSMSREERRSVLNTDQDIGIIRHQETCLALETLGYSREQIRFLPFGEWNLAKEKNNLRRIIVEEIHNFKPSCIFVPARYDKHVDHLSLNRETRNTLKKTNYKTSLFEYFVYYQWKLLPSGDIRTYIKPDRLLQIDLNGVSKIKRKALDCFVSQTTLYYDWQHKPVLSDQLLSKFSTGPELFMRIDPELRERDILTIPPLFIHLLNRLEPFLKNSKEKLLSIKHCMFRGKNISSSY